MAPNGTSTAAAVSAETETVDQPLFDTDYDLEKDLKTGERIITEEVAAQAVHRIGLAETAYKPIPYKQYFVWNKLIFVSVAHALALYSLTYLPQVGYWMLFYTALVAIFSTTLGIQVGGKNFQKITNPFCAF